MRLLVGTVIFVFSVALQALGLAIGIVSGDDHVAAAGIISKSSRSIDTCADPSLVKTVSQWFDGQAKTHAIDFHWAFVHTDTAQSGAFWMYQGPAFLAWDTQQPFTTPLWQLGAPDGSDYIYVLGSDGVTPPVVSGFSINNVVVAWVYATQICGSVPLMSAFFATQTDHYFTTDPGEHAHLLANRWEDSGIVAYVLPFPTPTP